MYASIANPTQDQSGRIKPGQTPGSTASHTRPQNRTRRILTFPLLLLFSFFLFPFALTAPTGASAADYSVDIQNGNNQTGNGTAGNPWRNITYALTQIVGTGHTIHVKAGVYDDTPGPGGLFETFPITLPQDYSLIGDDGSSSTTLDAKNTDGILKVSNSSTTVTIQGLSFVDGNEVGYGGGLSVTNSQALIEDCRFYSNIASLDGAAIYINVSSADIINCDLDSNQSVPTLTILASSSVRMSGCVVQNSGARGIYVNASTLRIMDHMRISYNQSEGLYIYESTFSAPQGLSVLNNRIHGIYMYRTSLLLENSEIMGNYTIAPGTPGGGIFFNGLTAVHTIELNNCTFKNNTAANGGALTVYNAKRIDIDNCTFTDNPTQPNGSAGGAIYASGAQTLNISSSYFKNNIAVGQGGSIYGTSISSARLEGCTFIGNSAGNGAEGGAIYFTASAGLSLVSNIFKDNVTNSLNAPGGCSSVGIVLFENNIISGNSGIGAYLVADPGGMIIRNNLFLNNRDGLEVGGAASISVVNNCFINNGREGVSVGNPATLYNNIFAGNGGHGIWEGSVSSDATAEFNIFFNNAALFYDEGNTSYLNLGMLESTVPEVNNNMVADPLFVDAAGGNYHIQSGSPARNAGVVIAGLTDDWDGEPRPEGAGYDIGADEYHGAHSADDNEDRIIDNWEMLRQVDLWQAATITLPQLNAIRVLWRSLRGYRSDGAGGFVAR